MDDVTPPASKPPMTSLPPAQDWKDAEIERLEHLAEQARVEAEDLRQNMNRVRTVNTELLKANVDLEKALTQATAENRKRRRQLAELELPGLDGGSTDTRSNLAARLEHAEAERDKAYSERAHFVAFLASQYHAVIVNPGEDWPVIIVELPTGQASWHLSRADLVLFDFVARCEHQPPCMQWDGHSTEEKYDRLDRLAMQQAMEGEG